MFKSEIKAPGPKVTSFNLNKLQQCQIALIKILGTMPITIVRILHEQSHPIPIIPSPTAGELLTHGRWHHGWLVVMAVMISSNSPSGKVPERRLLTPILVFGTVAA